MKLVFLKDVPLSPVSHDPGLNKSVLVGPGALPHIASLSHMRFAHGDRASAHSHEDGFEVFFCISGAVHFVVEGRPVELPADGCLVVEPGEVHSIEGAEEGSRIVYFRVKRQ
jgi:mannose-6-phosphate isomerase-like protein (cupin superfamily)